MTDTHNENCIDGKILISFITDYAFACDGQPVHPEEFKKEITDYINYILATTYEEKRKYCKYL
jgi:hypothetical protein